MTVNEKKMEERRQKERNLCYKRPALASLTAGHNQSVESNTVEKEKTIIIER